MLRRNKLIVSHGLIWFTTVPLSIRIPMLWNVVTEDETMWVKVEGWGCYGGLAL